MHPGSEHYSVSLCHENVPGAVVINTIQIRPRLHEIERKSNRYEYRNLYYVSGTKSFRGDFVSVIIVFILVDIYMKNSKIRILTLVILNCSSYV